jgi:hypothetical protein
MNLFKQVFLIILLLAISITRMSCVFAAMDNSKFGTSVDWILSDETDSESENESENEQSFENTHLINNQLNYFTVTNFQDFSTLFSLRSLLHYKSNSYSQPTLGCFTPPPINL